MAPRPSPSLAARLAGRVVLVTVHQLVGQVAHLHLTAEERRACEADHADLYRRFALYGPGSDDVAA